jgi:hypothetical protein
VVESAGPQSLNYLNLYRKREDHCDEVCKLNLDFLLYFSSSRGDGLDFFSLLPYRKSTTFVHFPSFQL